MNNEVNPNAQPKQVNSSKTSQKIILIVVLVICGMALCATVLAIGISTWITYSLNTPTPQPIGVVIPNPEPIPTNPAPTPLTPSGTLRYTDSKITFEYPATWEVVSTIPAAYKDTLLQYASDCTLFLQDSNDHSNVIAIDVSENETNCFSNGNFVPTGVSRIVEGTRGGSSQTKITISKWDDGISPWDKVMTEFAPTIYARILLIHKDGNVTAAEKGLDKIVETIDTTFIN